MPMFPFETTFRQTANGEVKKKKETFIDQFMKSFENKCLVKFNRWLIFDDINYRV